MRSAYIHTYIYLWLLLRMMPLMWRHCAFPRTVITHTSIHQIHILHEQCKLFFNNLLFLKKIFPLCSFSFPSGKHTTYTICQMCTLYARKGKINIPPPPSMATPLPFLLILHPPTHHRFLQQWRRGGEKKLLLLLLLRYVWESKACKNEQNGGWRGAATVKIWGRKWVGVLSLPRFSVVVAAGGVSFS